MKTKLRDRVVAMVCQYLTSRIEKNLRVVCPDDIKEGDVSFDKELKESLNKAIKLVPDSITIYRKR